MLSCDDNGRCELPAFISGMQQRLEEIDFDFDFFLRYQTRTISRMGDIRPLEELHGLVTVTCIYMPYARSWLLAKMIIG